MALFARPQSGRHGGTAVSCAGQGFGASWWMCDPVKSAARVVSFHRACKKAAPAEDQRKRASGRHPAADVRAPPRNRPASTARPGKSLCARSSPAARRGRRARPKRLIQMRRPQQDVRQPVTHALRPQRLRTHGLVCLEGVDDGVHQRTAHRARAAAPWQRPARPAACGQCCAGFRSAGCGSRVSWGHGLLGGACAPGRQRGRDVGCAGAAAPGGPVRQPQRYTVARGTGRLAATMPASFHRPQRPMPGACRCVPSTEPP